jgi:hypothetical protein
MENQENLVSIENTIEQPKLKNLDDFFAAFESKIAAPIIFKRPEEGEACEACSG